MSRCHGKIGASPRDSRAAITPERAPCCAAVRRLGGVADREIATAGAPVTEAGPQRSRHLDAAPSIIWGASAALTALGLVLYLENRRVPGTSRFFDPVLPALALSFPGVGALILSRARDNVAGWLFSSTALVSVAFASEQYAVYALLTRPGDLPGGTWMAWLGAWSWAPGYLVAWTLVPLLFPDGRLPAPRWRPLVWAVVALIAASVVFAALAAENVDSPALDNPLGTDALPNLSGVPQATCLLVLGPLCLLGLLARYRRSAPDERVPLRGFVGATSVAVLLPVTAALVGLVFGTQPPVGPYQAAGSLAVLAMAAAVVVAAVRHGLYDVRIEPGALVNRLVVYGCLAFVAAVVYALVVVGFDALVSGSPGPGAPVLALVSAGLVCHFARRRLGPAVDRLLYRKRDYDYESLAALSQRLRSTVGADAVLPALVETIAAALKVSYVAVTVGRGGAVVASAAYGNPRDDALVVPLVHQNEEVGQLRITPRSPDEPFDAVDRRLLDDLAGQSAVAAYALSLTADLQRSRERLVTTREEERRRLRRELHDGLQPVLGGVVLGLGAVRNMMARGGPEAPEILARLQAELESAGADLRRLVYDLRPPALDELGLVGALRQHANRFSLAPDVPEVSVEAADDLEGMPAAVEVAAYRIGQEAIENARKHAGARSCRVVLEVVDGELHVEVRDDGRGVAPDHRIGVGLVAMRERAAELGGTCAVESAPSGGTCVRARFPLVSR